MRDRGYNHKLEIANHKSAMSQEPKATNPFYILLMVVGAVFALTASAYFVMALRMKTPDVASLDSAAPLTLVTFLDRYGIKLMLWELAALAIATFAAIGTDNFWIRRAKARAEQKGSRGEEDERTQ